MYIVNWYQDLWDISAITFVQQLPQMCINPLGYSLNELWPLITACNSLP